MKAIQVQDLRRDFGDLRGVDGIDFAVERGEISGFLDPNGAGKTTTIRLLLGLLEPTGGRAEVLGYDTRTQGEEIRAHTGALLEHPGIHEQMSAEDNLEFYGRAYRLPADERHARIRALLTQMGLWERRKDAVGKWSRGMAQKLALARALLHRPSLVLLDVPSAVREDLAALAAREGVTIYLTTHNTREAEQLCDRVAVIRQGRLVAVGDPDQLRARAGGPRIEIRGRGFDERALRPLRGDPNVAAVEAANGHLVIDLQQEAAAAPLVSLLVGAGAQVEEVRRGVASLEEVFLTLMREDPPYGEGRR